MSSHREPSDHSDRQGDGTDHNKQGTDQPWKRPGQASQNPDQPEPDKPERTQETNKTA